MALPCREADAQKSWVYLYACGPQCWDLNGGLRGHAGSTVAYCVGPEVAKRLIEFADREVLAASPEEYSGWDSQLGFWLNARGIETYVPYRQFGEHGGLPNPEHAGFGLRKHHRADTLLGPLSFLPLYARESRLRMLLLRAEARVWGLGRLLAGRFLSWRDFSRSSERVRLLRVALGRQLWRKPPSWLGTRA